MFTHRDGTITIPGTCEVVEVQFKELVVQRIMCLGVKRSCKQQKDGLASICIYVFIYIIYSICEKQRFTPQIKSHPCPCRRVCCGTLLLYHRHVCTTAQRYGFQHGKITSRPGEGAKRSTRLRIVFSNGIVFKIIRIEKNSL